MPDRAELSLLAQNEIPYQYVTDMGNGPAVLTDSNSYNDGGLKYGDESRCWI